MKLTSLSLTHFRSYSEKTIEFTHPLTVVVGPNAAGKTNILEAISIIALGKSYRAGSDEEMISFREDFGRVKASVGDETLEILLTHGLYNGKRVAKKRYIVNGLGKRLQDFVQHLRVVLFEPEDVQLVIGSPGKKRDYLDFVLSQVDRKYVTSLHAYTKGLRQRNKLLSFIAEGRARINQLEYWDSLLVTEGAVIQEKRETYLDFLNVSCCSPEFTTWLSREHEKPVTLSFLYTPSRITFERLHTHREAEIATGTTLIGPHRDSFMIEHHIQGHTENRDVARYGSRGEQRMTVLALKLAELDYITKLSGERPLLLLDDIFSELDDFHQDVVLEIVNKQQTLLTTTTLEFLKAQTPKDYQVIELK